MRNIAVLPPIKSKVQMALMSLTASQEINTQDLISSAHSFPGGTKVHIPDRVTAIVLLLGPKPRLGRNLSADHIRCADNKRTTHVFHHFIGVIAFIAYVLWLIFGIVFSVLPRECGIIRQHT
jgi:hypothetical protein